MRSILISLGLVLALPVSAQEGQVATEFDLSLSRNQRGGDAVNGSGPPLTEVEDYNLARLAARVAIPTTGDMRFQFGLMHDESMAETTVGGVPSNDTYRSASLLSLQVGSATDDRYLGGFAALGEVRFNPDDSDQNADFHALGVEGLWYFGDFSLGGQLGLLDSSAENPETLSDATFAAANLSYFFDDQTRFGASAAFASGDQDVDSGSGPDPVDLLALGLEIERGFSFGPNQHAASVYGSVDWLRTREGSSSGVTEEATDLVLGIGIRIAFGPASNRARHRAFAPRLPQFGRWLGAVPAVD